MRCLLHKPLLALLLALAVATIGMSFAVAKSKVSASRYVGAEQCRGCHEQAYRVWKSSAHARALDGLSTTEQADQRCLQCHSTDPEEGNNEAVTGVQCEACHGAGRYYSQEHIMRDSELRDYLGFKKPNKSSCLRCHTETTPSIQVFSYEEKYELIRHEQTK